MAHLCVIKRNFDNFPKTFISLKSIVWGDVNKNGRVKTSENLFLHKISEKTGKKKKRVRINLFRTLEMNQKLAAIWGVFVHKNGWISVNKDNFMAF